MPGRDGTGPLGQGAMTGRGLGVCAHEIRPIWKRLGLRTRVKLQRVFNPVYADSKKR